LTSRRLKKKDKEVRGKANAVVEEMGFSQQTVGLEDKHLIWAPDQPRSQGVKD
jgi:hypothetical protein